MTYQIDRPALRVKAAVRALQQSKCEHEFVGLDPGPYSDDIVYIVCKKCDFQKL